MVQEQLNAYENMRDRGELREGVALMDSELRRRGFYTEGVKSAVGSGWKQRTQAEKVYAESFLKSSQFSSRSELTTANSLRLYSSFYPHSKEMSIMDLTFLLGRNAKGTSAERRQEPLGRGVSHSPIVARAKRLGIEITSHSDLLKQRNQPLFQFERRTEVPPGFEMINEDFFARKDNKFMVFNGPGVDSWRGTDPETKIAGIADMLLGTLE